MIFINSDRLIIRSWKFEDCKERVINKCGFQHKFNKSTTVKVLGNRIVTELFYCIIKNKSIF